MKPRYFVRAARALALAGAACMAAPAVATPLTEMRIDDLLPMAQEARKAMTLSANQQTLWQQVESKTRAIIRERQSRRERLQQHTRQGLEGDKVELRDLVGALNAETAASAAEEQQLRELWLTLNDALDERQRQTVVTLLVEQMQRVTPAGAPAGSPRGREEGAGHMRGGGRKGGGMPGGGMPGG